ncbi:LytR/AlgR family response regulator transcription factor [Paenimyroides aestuarii]|uniref:LytTR family DNA-binding domain-containing protein n=1 Tax=Paenimyroides aestuarii TaxID=2968490 RepID=A0ABY5NUV6_9FLAO|nr:LytTR family DNA-binding domain-containing protein [Paenimyroides aestuarii]UUV22370.1 LytTR family DNA-binding domain-containing protein [Paenimyroides aestuarii]
MLKTLIIDDESLIRNSLKILLSERNDIEIIGEASSKDQGIALIETLKPDLVLLDIQLKKNTGFELLEQLSDITFKLIFVTAYSEYAIKAFKYSAFDYLLKPIDQDLLNQTIDRLKTEIITTSQQYQALKTNKEFHKITIKTTEHIYHLNFDEIIYCKADSSYTRFYLTNDRSLMTSKPLKNYQNLLPEHQFFRSHQSYLVNLNFVKKYNKKMAALEMQDQTEIPVSVRNRSKVNDLF